MARTGVGRNQRSTETPTRGGVLYDHYAVAVPAENVVVNVDVAGAITWTGQAVGLKTSIEITAGAITWTGQTIDLKTTITPAVGNITWAGATDITLVAGGNIVIDVTVPGAITWTGQTVNLLVDIPATAGNIAWTGSEVGLKTLIGVAPGAITWQGSPGITTGATVTIEVTTPGAITWSGQAPSLKFKVAVVPGAVTWSGATITLVRTITPIAGAITWTGSSGISLPLSSVITVPGSITWTGQEITLVAPVPVVISEGDLFNIGHTVPMEGDFAMAGVEGDSTVTGLGS